MGRKVKDWQIMAVLAFVVSFFFLLQQYTNLDAYKVVVAYSIMSFGSSIAVYAAIQRLGEPGGANWVLDWDENFKLSHAIWAALGVAGIFFVSLVFLSGTIVPQNQVLYVPVSGVVSLEALGRPATEALWQTFVVAHAEEYLKLAMIVVLGSRIGEWPAVVTSVGVWAAMHAFLAFASLAFILPTFMAGLALYVTLRLTNNIIVPVVGHAAYNWIVVIVVAGLAP